MFSHSKRQSYFFLSLCVQKIIIFFPKLMSAKDKKSEVFSKNQM